MWINSRAPPLCRQTVTCSSSSDRQPGRLQCCLNGGGQVKASSSQNQKELLHQVEELYKVERPLLPENNTRVAELYETWLHTLGEEKAKELLHTQYHTVEKMTNGLTIKW